MLNELRSHIVTRVPVGGRMYPEILPQLPVLPAITYQIISEWRRPTMHGTDRLPRTRVQVDCYANTSIEANAIADAVLHAVDGFQGVMGSPAVEISAVFAANTFSGYDYEAKAYRRSRDYVVWARD